MRSALVLLIFFATPASAEFVDVRYRGFVDLKPFTCTDTVSSFVNRVCYDAKERYMLIQLKNTWYHYCEIPKAIADSLIASESMGGFYNANIKGKGGDGPYDCRTHRVPSY